MEIQVRGGNRMSATGRALERAAARLPQALQDAMQEAAAPIIAAARQRALDTLPKKNGLNRFVAASRFQVQPIHSSARVGVRIHTSDHDSRLDSAGRLRHPVFGADIWVTQLVRPGWFSVAAREHQIAARAAIARAFAAFVAEVREAAR